MIMEFSQLPFDFPGNIYRSAMPYSSYDPEGRLIQAYQDNNISLIVMLAGPQETLRITGRNLSNEYSDQGFEVISLPIEDFEVPELDQVRETIQKILTHTQTGENIAVHCHAGVGRTGMLMACLAKIGLGYSAEDSIHWVRDHLPGAIEVPKQEQLVRMV